MKQPSGAFHFGCRILLFFPVIPSGYPGRYHRKKHKTKSKSTEIYRILHHANTPSGKVRSGPSRNNGPSASSLEGRCFGNASTFRHYAARKGPLIFSQCSLWTLPCPNFPLYLPKSGRYSSTACQLCLPDFGTLVQFSFSSFLILFHHHFSLLPLSKFLLCFFSFLSFTFLHLFILFISFYFNLIINFFNYSFILIKICLSTKL